MYDYLNGEVARKGTHLAVIDCGGVGYACRTTAYTLSGLETGKTAKLYTYLNVREDVMELYGFGTEEERSCFEMLISVSGVGPKAALAILSATTPAQLAISILSGDEKALMSAPGIGKKIAQRVILELKDRLTKDQLSGSTKMPENKAGEAAAALAVLGYTQADISTALRGLDMDDLTLEEVIKQALKKMMR